MHAKAKPLFLREPLEHSIVEIHKLIEKFARRIQLQRQPAFRKVDLHANSACFQTTANIGFCFVYEVFQKLLS